MSWRTWRFDPMYEGFVVVRNGRHFQIAKKYIPRSPRNHHFLLNKLVIKNELTVNHHVLLRKDVSSSQKRTVTIFFRLKNTGKNMTTCSNSKNSTLDSKIPLKLQVVIRPGHAALLSCWPLRSSSPSSYLEVYIRPQTFFMWCWWHSCPSGFFGSKKKLIGKMVGAP